MTGIPDFLERRHELQMRLRRQGPRSLFRRRLERELRDLVMSELRIETHSLPQLTNEPAPRASHWLQRWEDRQENDR
jgi:hypothetical protein